MAFVTVAIWGSTFISTKLLIYAGLSPAHIFTLRFIIAYLLMLALAGPYRGGSAASAARLSPAQLSAHDHLTSELLRTLSRMAASEPTSWLSPRPHILSHLARA